jgi:beta-lactam-binding protein with PASTA domain
LAQVSADRDADPSNDAASATLDVIRRRPTATRRCVVPWLTGKPALKAAAILERAGCSVGHITRRRATRQRSGRIVTQSPRRDRRINPGGKVDFVVAR